MYGKGAGFLTSNTTGASGAVSLLGGAAVLPQTTGNTALLALALTTIALGGLIVLSFVSTRAIAHYLK